MTEFRVLRPVLPAVVLGMVGLVWLFFPEESSAFHVWKTSTAYNHCFLIIPIACWLIFERRHNLSGLQTKPTALAIVPFCWFVCAWLVANRLGVMEGRQLSAVGIVQSVLFGALGWRVYKTLSPGFLYLFFLVPFGGFLVPTLQAFTTSFTAFFLNLLEIPNYVSGFTIQIAAGTFQIAEACAGLRFLIAAIAFSVFYSLLFFRSPARRIIFVALSVIVPIIANGFRALGIVWLGAELGSAQAAATDHIVYGYIFFSCVIGILIWLGLAFREDHNRGAPRRTQTMNSSRSASAIKALLVTTAIILGTMATLSWTSYLDQVAASGVLPSRAQLLGCEIRGESALPFMEGSGGRLESFTCDGGTIMAKVAMFPARTAPGIILDTYRKMSQEDEAGELVVTTKLPVERLPDWEIAVNPDVPETVFSTLVIRRHSSSGNLLFRIDQARQAILGGTSPASIITVSTPGDDDMAKTRLTQFIGRERGFP